MMQHINAPDLRTACSLWLQQLRKAHFYLHPARKPRINPLYNTQTLPNTRGAKRRCRINPLTARGITRGSLQATTAFTNTPHRDIGTGKKTRRAAGAHHYGLLTLPRLCAGAGGPSTCKQMNHKQAAPIWQRRAPRHGEQARSETGRSGQAGSRQLSFSA